MDFGPSNSVPSTTLCDLPVELLLEIIQRLDNPALVNLALTCHHLHFLALETFFSNNDICDPKAGWLVAYKAPVEALPALRKALYVQWLDQLHYSFNPPIDRIIEQVRDLRAFIARLPPIRLVRLQYFSAVDYHVLYGQGKAQVLNPVWKEEFQSLLDLVLEKGCRELFVQGGETIIGLYLQQGDVAESSVDDVGAVSSDINVRGRKPRKSSFGKARLEVTHAPVLPASNTKPIQISIHSDMLLQSHFLEWSITMVNAAASTITTLSMKNSTLSKESWKRFLHNVTLPELLDFEIICDQTYGPSFIDVHGFLSRHCTTIETLQLYGMEIWYPPNFIIPILPRLKRIMVHPTYMAWVLHNLLFHKDACPNLAEIGISSEFRSFDYALFDWALERIAGFPHEKIKLTLRFATFGERHMNDWIQAHLATYKESKSTVISQLSNVTSLVISSFPDAAHDCEVVEMLPDWLGMFSNVTAIEFTD